MPEQSNNSEARRIASRREAYLRPADADPPAEAELELDRRGLVIERRDSEGQAQPKSATKDRTKLAPLSNPRRPGFSATGRDWEKVRLVFAEQLRREGWLDGPEFDRELQRRVAGCQSSFHPDLAKYYRQLMQVSWCPDRKTIRDHVEAQAIRQTPELVAAEQVLSGSKYGRPTERKLAIATFLRLALGDCRPELRATIKAFEGSDRELDWAYLDTPDPKQVKAYLRDETCVRRTIKAMLERNEAEQIWAWNATAITRLAQRHEDVGRYLFIDSTPVEAHLEQGGDVSEEHGALLNNGSGAKFGHHGGRNRRPKSWRGWKFLTIGCMKLGLVLIGTLIPANAPEYPYLPDLIERMLSLMPWLDPEYLVADSEFDRHTRIAFDLQHLYGIVPVFDLRATLSADWDWAETEGVPRCSKHGEMTLEQVDEPKYERAVSLDYEPDFDLAKKELKTRLRWSCRACKAQGDPVRATTWVKDNARIYTVLPRQGSNWRVALRQALMLRRNHAESINSQLKLRGLGGKGHYKAKWATREPHMRWLAYFSALAMTLRRDAHESGLYASAAKEAEQLKLVKKRLQIPENAISMAAAHGKAAAKRHPRSAAGQVDAQQSDVAA